MLMLLIAKAAKTMRDRVLRARHEGDASHEQAEVTRAARRARAEADEVRTMAAAHMRHDPNFAKELYAAAERHEQLALNQA